MPDEDKGTRDLVAEAVHEVLNSSEEQAGEAQDQRDTEAGSSSDAEGRQTDVSTETPKVEAPGDEGTTEEGTEEKSDVPTEYFGLDLSDIEPSKRKEIFDHILSQDAVVRKLMEERATSKPEGDDEKPARVEQESKDDETPALSDEDVMKMLGVDPEDPMYDVKSEIALPLAKPFISLSRTVEGLVDYLSAQENLGQWEGTFDKMEAEFGKLPVSRERIYEYAEENNISDPEAAFLKVWARGHKGTSEEATKVRNAAFEELKKQMKGNVRPSRSSPSTTKDVEAKDVRAAVLEAAKVASEESGLDWDEAIKADPMLYDVS